MPTPRPRDSTDALLTVAEVAAHLRVNKRTVRNLIKRGELTAVKLGGRPNSPIRIEPAALQALLAPYTKRTLREGNR